MPRLNFIIASVLLAASTSPATAGPKGWTRSEYAWLFKRNRRNRLELANTILIGVIE